MDFGVDIISFGSSNMFIYILLCGIMLFQCAPALNKIFSQDNA